MKTTLQNEKGLLDSALVSFKFPKKYFIYHVNRIPDLKFALASKDENGALNTHTKFYNRDEMYAYLIGWYDAKMKKF